MKQRLWFFALGLLLCWGCQESETVPAKTQITLRIQSSDQELLDAMTELRLSIWREGESGWLQRSSAKIASATIRWPLDVPITPSSSAAAAAPFEVIVEAWGDDGRLAQTRAVTRFVQGSARVLELWIVSCHEHELGFVCADPDCHGEACLACTSAGECAPVGLQPANDEYDGSQRPAIKPLPSDMAEALDGGALDALDGSNGNAGLDAASDLDAAVQSIPMTCNPTCSTTSECVVDTMGAHCTCLPGYQNQAGSCDDVDECKLGTHGCSENATCLNTPGGHSCACREDYNDVKGDGTQCVDKCQGACDSHAACSVLDGTVSCQCTGSYTGDGKTCTLNPSCEVLNCGANSSCTLRPGTTDSYQCGCLAGFELMAGQCGDIDECKLTPAACGTGATCANTPGSRTCTCLAGFQKNASTGACENIDDCKQTPCMNGGICSDLVADYACDCGTSGYNGKQCQTNKPDCPAGACASGVCIDGVNDYACTCNTGYRVATSGKACEIVSCPLLTAPGNGGVTTPNGSNYNATATYTCVTGFKLTGAATRTCGATGAWSGAAPTCSQVLCPTLTNPQNGTVSAPNRAVGQPATYVCNAGYGVSGGNATRTCQDDGQGNGVWSGSAATCALSCTINDSCAPGNACLADPDCGNVNRCVSGICLIPLCTGGSTLLATAADFDKVRYCVEIEGDLTIKMATNNPTTISFPYTTRVTGILEVQGTSNVTGGRMVSFPVLTRAGALFSQVLQLDVQLSFPNLARVDDIVSISLGEITLLDLDKLTTVGNSFTLYALSSLRTLRLSSLSSVGPGSNVYGLFNIGYRPTLSRLEVATQVAGGVTVANSGCCFPTNGTVDCQSPVTDPHCM